MIPATSIPYRRPAPLPKDALVVHFSKLRMLGLIALDCLLLAACLYCSTIPKLKAQLAGWAGLIFFGFALLWMVWQMGRMEPVLVIGHDGIDNRRLSIGTVPWSEVTDVSVGEMKGQRFLCFTLRDEEQYLPQLRWHQRMLAKANREMGFPLLTIGFTGTDATLEDGLAAVERFRAVTTA